MQEASLRKVLAVLVARWLLVVGLALPVLLASWGYAATLPPAQTASVVLSFAPAQGAYAGSSFTRLIARYELTATSDEAVSHAEQQAGLEPGGLTDSVSADFPAGALELELTVTTPDEDVSLAAAGALVDPVEEAVDEDPLVTVWVAAGPELTGDQSPRRRVLALAAGLLLAPVPGAAVALMLEGSRPRIRLREDVRSTGLTVLATLPRRLISGRTSSTRPPLRLWLFVTEGLRHGPDDPAPWGLDVIVTSIDGHDGDAVEVVQGLLRAQDSIGTELAQERIRPTFRAAPLHATAARGSLAVVHDGGAAAVPRADPSGSPPAAAADRGHHCVLVMRAGVPVDVVRAVSEDLDRLGIQVLGCVLITR